jgi:hemolysin type calcium-binding protein
MSRRIRRRSLTMVLALIGYLLAMPGTASAAVVAIGSVNFPSTVTVGQTGVSATIRMENGNTSPDGSNDNLVCNAADLVSACTTPISDPGILLVPSCKALAGNQCAPAGADPGVFQLSATGTATAAPGTACAAYVFTITPLGDAFGTVRFTPQPPGNHVLLNGPANPPANFCEVAFTFDVLKSPTGDLDPGAAGIQTAQVMRHRQCAILCFLQASSSVGIGTDVTTFPAQATTCAGLSPTRIGTNGNDNILGTPGKDVILGLGGNDNISGLGGDDAICGGAGNDRLTGGDGNDALLGEAGDDELTGGSGNDKLIGGVGTDKCIGGSGTDTAATCEVQTSVP